MKFLTILILLFFFVFICIGLTNTMENFKNNMSEDSASLSEDKKESASISDDKESASISDEKESASVSDDEEDIKKFLDNIKEHPATETAIEIKKQKIKNDRPINITVSYNVIDRKEQHKGQKEHHKMHPVQCKCPKCAADYITGTVSNRMITTGYGASTTLGSGPVNLDFSNAHTVPQREYLMNPAYQKVGSPLGSTDNAKISRETMDVFNDAEADCYTLLKEKYISFPQKRYSTTDLANMGFYK